MFTAFAALALTSGGCSLMGLERYPLAVCHAQADCEPLNTSRGIAATACQRFQCVPDADQNGQHTCRLRARDGDGDGDPSMTCGGTDCDDDNAARSARVLDPNTGALVPRRESCDGVDNDCNGIVDEGALFSGDATMLQSSLASAAHVRVAPALAGWPGLVIPPSAPGDTTRWVQPMPSGADTSLRFRTQANTNAPFTTPAKTADDQSKCFQPAPMGIVTVDCFPGEAAAAEIDVANSGTMVLAALDRNGCAGGLLRVGVFEPSTHGPVDGLGPARRSPLVNGIGTTTWPVVLPSGMLDPAGPSAPTYGTCTGQSNARTPTGATRPVVAPLGATAVPHAGMGAALPQALVAWLGRPASADPCNAPAAPVEAQVVWLEGGVPPGWSWLNASASGQPATLGFGRGDAPPAIVATQSPPGYLVAFPDSNAGVALRFISAVDTSVVAPLDNAVVDLATYDSAPEVARHTPALVVRDLGTVLTGAVEAVAMAPRTHGTSGSTLDLGVIVQSGCGDRAIRNLRFARVTVDLAGGAAVASNPIALGGSASTLPQIQYLPSGILAPSSQWHGQTVTADLTGGWWAAWLDNSLTPPAMVLYRLSEVDGAAVDMQPAPVPLVPPTSAAEGVLFPTMDHSAGAHALALVTLTARAAFLTGAACQAAP